MKLDHITKQSHTHAIKIFQHPQSWASMLPVNFGLLAGSVLNTCGLCSYHTHSMSDSGNYREREEVASVKKNRDPIELVRKRLIKNNLADAKDLKAREMKIEKELEVVIEECKAASQPPLNMLQANLYADPTNAVMRGTTSDKYIQATYQPYVESQ
jgi:pyruvate dehydrogenase E1 component alpha subunit